MPRTAGAAGRTVQRAAAAGAARPAAGAAATKAAAVGAGEGVAMVGEHDAGRTAPTSVVVVVAGGWGCGQRSRQRRQRPGDQRGWGCRVRVCRVMTGAQVGEQKRCGRRSCIAAAQMKGPPALPLRHEMAEMAPSSTPLPHRQRAARSDTAEVPAGNGKRERARGGRDWGWKEARRVHTCTTVLEVRMELYRRPRSLAPPKSRKLRKPLGVLGHPCI